jgi:hypothetical protein
MKTQYRQGDCFIVRLSKAPKADLKEIPRENGRVVLAHGESTGHSHAIADQAARFMLNEQTLQRFLEIKEPSTLRHEEHRAFELPVGDYEVILQREYNPASIRNVLD